MVRHVYGFDQLSHDTWQFKNLAQYLINLI